MTTYPKPPGHRGVETSVAAAAALEPKLDRIAIIHVGMRGLTADELAAHLDMARWSVQPRTTELKCMGHIHGSGRRRFNAPGRHAIVWVSAGT